MRLQRSFCMDLLQVSLAEKREKEKREKVKMRERLVILGMLINIHELSSLLPFSK